MKKSKTQKGITLIALIITIVVLLILAVVAISSIQNDGILSYANNASIAYNQAQKNEQDILDGYLSYMPGNSSSTVATWSQNGITVTNGTDTVEVGDRVKLKVGDGEAVSYTAGDYTGEWAVLGAKDGKLLLISATNVKNYSSIETELYLNKGKELNDIAANYLNSTYADEARSITIEDINRVTGFEPSSYDGYGTTYTYNNETHNGFMHVDGRTIGQNGVTSIEVTSNYYEYYLASDLPEKVNEILFIGMSTVCRESYWIASTYDKATSDSVEFGLFYVAGGGVSGQTIWYSNNGLSGNNHGVAAVVSIKPEVQIVKVDA